MTAMITASIVAASLRLGLRCISRQEFLKKPLTLRGPISYTFSDGHQEYYDKALVPDAIFGIEYPNGGRLYFVVEADLGNEPVYRKNFTETSFLRKVLQYKAAILGGLYKDDLGIQQGLVVLTFTSYAKHMRAVLEMTQRELGKARYLLFTALPEFNQHHLNVPDPIYDILERKYARAGHESISLHNLE